MSYQELSGAKNVIDNAISELNLTIDKLENKIHRGLPDWIWDNTRLVKHEKNFIGDSILIVSPDLSNDVDDGTYVPSIQKAVKLNIKRKIKYTYLVPDSPLLRGRSKKLYELFSENKELVTIIWIPLDVFKVLWDFAWLATHCNSSKLLIAAKV